MNRRKFGMYLIGLVWACTGDAGLAVPPPEIPDAMQAEWDGALEIRENSGSTEKSPNGAGSSSAGTAFTSHKVGDPQYSRRQLGDQTRCDVQRKAEDDDHQKAKHRHRQDNVFGPKFQQNVLPQDQSHRPQ